MTVLPSAYCVLDYDKNTKTASAIGGGFGHGIGMSQYGAGRNGHRPDIPAMKF